MSGILKILPSWGRWQREALTEGARGRGLAPSASLRSAPPPMGEDLA